MSLGRFYRVIASTNVDLVTARMAQFLADNQNHLDQGEVEHVMAAYAYRNGNREHFRAHYPEVHIVELHQQDEDGVTESVNKLVGGNYLPPHCVQFTKKYRLSINAADPFVKMNFYNIFALRWETQIEKNMFDSHQRLSRGINVQPVEVLPISARDDNLNAMLNHLGTDKNYVVMTGAGVSAQLVDDTIPDHWDTVSKWSSLLKLLRERIESFVGDTIAGYFKSWYPVALDTDANLMERAHMLHSMIKVYNLHNSADVDYTRFISALFKVIKPKSPLPQLVSTLRNLNVLIGTTNYDMILEEALGRFEYNLPDCFEDVYSIAAINAEARKLFPMNYLLHIYHLHGVFHSKAELTLGVEYGNCNRRFQCAMDALTQEYEHPTSTVFLDYDTAELRNIVGEVHRSITKPVVFVGTGSGVFDYHFTNWLSRCYQRHYILVRAGDFNNISASIQRVNLTGKLIPVVYGNVHEELNAFIANHLPVRPPIIEA